MERDKIIQGLKWCIKADKQCVYALVDCPYVEQCKTGGRTELKKDALAYIENHVLNEQMIKDLCAVIEDKEKREEELIQIIKELTQEKFRKPLCIKNIFRKKKSYD